MKTSNYDYVFTNIKTNAKLRFQSTNIETATAVLASMVISVGEWNMKRFKAK